MPRRLLAATAALSLTILPLAACAKETPKSADGSEKLRVVTSFYPLEYLVAQVGGDRVDVTNLTKPGTEPHDLELSPQDVAQVNKATLVVYQKSMQPAVDKAVATEAKGPALDIATAVDLSVKFDPAIEAEAGHGDHDHEGHDHAHETAAPTTGASRPAASPSSSSAGHEHEHEVKPGTVDPHFWLDPQRYGKAAEAVAAKLKELDPSHAATYDANLKGFLSRTTALDGSFRAGLKTCASKHLVTSHAAFGYLAHRYGFRQVAIAGLSPTTEPAPGQLTAVTDFAKKNRVKTIYAETLVDPKVAQTVAKETGAVTAVLDPIEGLTQQSAARDYFGIMEANLKTLTKGQQCS